MTSITPDSGLLERVQSSLHGLGLAAAQPISRGTLLLIGTRASHNGPLAWQTCGDLSFLNHSCTPNIEVSYLPSTPTWNVHAICDISTGKELLASYVDPYQAKLTRQSGLDFGCRCAVCRFPANELAESDLRRSLIGTGLQTLATFRARHFGSLSADEPMRLDPVNRVSIAADVQVSGINALAGRVLRDAKDEGLLDSRLAFAYDAAAVTNYFLRCEQTNGSGEMEEAPLQRSIEDRQQQLQWLVACLGQSHPRGQKCLAYVLACRMVLNELRQRSQPESSDACSEDEQTGGPMWESFGSSTHGQGVRAAHSIKKEELIMHEACLLNLPGKTGNDEQNLLNSVRDAADGAKAFVLLMVDTSKELSERWPTSKRPAYAKPLRTIADLDRAIDNDGVKIGPYLRDSIHHVCFPFVSGATEYQFTQNGWQLNHSCNPNAEASWDPETRQFSVYAIADIRKGDEIFVPYINIYRTKAIRRQLLGFRGGCKCSACSMEDSDPGQFQKREEAMELYASNWKKLKAYRRKYPQVASTLTRDIVSAIVKDAEHYRMLQLIVGIQARHDNAMIGMTSDAPFFFEVASFLRMTLYLHAGEEAVFEHCMKDKREELDLLGQCLGNGHSRTRAALEEYQLMKNLVFDAGEEDGEEDDEGPEEANLGENGEQDGGEDDEGPEEGDLEENGEQEVGAGAAEGTLDDGHTDCKLMESDDLLANIAGRLKLPDEDGGGK
ncbi:hypothetical protein LTR17_001291 [Elasticomyces elasticus]|nr:hypothetical protein LTR17_001291 [Elasticomyces elasticus]